MSPLGPPCTALSCTHSPRARVVVRVHRHVWPYAPPSVCQGVWTGSAVGGWDRSRADRGSAISALGQAFSVMHAGRCGVSVGDAIFHCLVGHWTIVSLPELEGWYWVGKSGV